MKIRLLFVLLVILAASSETALACSPLKSGEPPCASWTRADVVFSGKVLKIESVPQGEEFPDGSKKVRFQVLENFKGADNPTFAVVFKSSETGVKKGETWIVYARTDIVGKSFAEFRRVRIEPKQTSEELETLKNIVAGKTSSAITGQIALQGEPVEITIEGGGKRFTARTDAAGAFNLDVPSDGKYTVEIKFPYRAALKWDENLLGASLTEGTPTVFRYEVRLNDGDCHFGSFEVIKN